MFEAVLAVEAPLVRVVDVVVVDIAPHRKVTPFPSKNIPSNDDESAESRLQASLMVVWALWILLRHVVEHDPVPPIPDKSV